MEAYRKALSESAEYCPAVAHQHNAYRNNYLLGAVPIIRLALLAVAILWLIPIIFNITWQNLLVISGAASVAIGFAFKDPDNGLLTR